MIASNPTTAHVAACPYCEHKTPGAGTRDEAKRRLGTHVTELHADRLEAARVYRQALQHGSSVQEAIAASNATLRRLAGGPGSYQRRT